MAAPDAEDCKVQVVLDREAQEKPRSLKRSGQPGPRAQACGLMSDVFAEQLDPALRRGELAGNHVEQGRLAGSVQADDGPAPARLDCAADSRVRARSAD